MPNELQVFAFQFQGAAETKPKMDANNKVISPPDTDVVSILNRESDKIVQEIQQEVGRLLPPSVTVRAEVRFYLVNSFVFEGMVLLSSWVAPIMLRVGKRVLEGGEKAFTDQLVHLIKMGVQRAFQHFLAGPQKPAALQDATIELPQLSVTAESIEIPTDARESSPPSPNTQGQQPTTLQIASPLRVELIQPQPSTPAGQTTGSLPNLTTRNLVLITAASTAFLTLVFAIFVIVVLNLVTRPGGESIPKQSPKAEQKSSALPQGLGAEPEGFEIRGTRVPYPGRA